MPTRIVLVLALLDLGPALLAQQSATPTIDFSTQIQPIFARCTGCHGGSDPRGQFHLDVGSLALKGGASGTVIIPGDGHGSPLVQRIRGEGKQPRMPLTGNALTPEQIQLVEKWIDQGAKWPEPQ